MGKYKTASLKQGEKRKEEKHHRMLRGVISKTQTASEKRQKQECN